MEEIKIGVRLLPREGLHFFGLDIVNERIREGARVVAMDTGGAIMTKVGEDDENVRMSLAGFQVKVFVENST